jgi:methylglutaconyl-CoA hydratase
MTAKRARPMKPADVPTLRVGFVGDDPVGRITLSRPEKRNALDPEMIRQLSAALEAAARDEAVKVVVLTGEGKDFCAGADLESLSELIDADESVHRADARAIASLFMEMRSFPKPIVTVIRGRALAGGAGLVMASDIAIASEDAQLGFPEVRIGFVAGMVMALLRRSIDEKAAFELVATGRVIQAEEALRIGLVTRVVGESELDATVEHTVRTLADLPAESVARTKRLFYEIDTLLLNEALERGVEANVSARTTKAFKEGLASFIAGRRQ